MKPVMFMNMNALSKNFPNPNLGPLEEIVIEINSPLKKMFLFFISDEGHLWILNLMKMQKKGNTHYK